VCGICQENQSKNGVQVITWTSRLAAASIFIAFSAGFAQADIVMLTNGDRLSGTIVSKENGDLILQTSYAGEVKIRWSDITQIISVQPVSIYLDDGRHFKGTTAAGADGQMTIQPAGNLPAEPYDLAHVRWINPSPHISGEGIKWEGRFNLGAASTRGNTDTEKVHSDAEVIARTLKNRYTAGFAYNRGKTLGVLSESNSLGYLKYDRFLTPRWYGYLNGSAERDTFKDIDLRTIVGAGSGFQIIETPRTYLSLEGGISDVRTNFGLAPDEDYPALRWALKYEQFLFDSKVQFFHHHEALMGIGDTKRAFVKSATGLRIPVVDRLNLTVQYNVDWENEPAPGGVPTDRAVLLMVGYQF
jgi:putative salt-induced outer membrane protein YdiY